MNCQQPILEGSVLKHISKLTFPVFSNYYQATYLIIHHQPCLTLKKTVIFEY